MNIYGACPNMLLTTGAVPYYVLVWRRKCLLGIVALLELISTEMTHILESVHHIKLSPYRTLITVGYIICILQNRERVIFLLKNR